jgi:hypothetical protein
MGTQTTKAKQSSRKKTTRRKNSALSTCPVGSAGWCSYPFSAAQLQKRLRAKVEAEQQPSEEKELAAAGSGRRSK